MIITRELMIRRRFIWVEGEPEVPMPVVLHQWKKLHFLFT